MIQLYIQILHSELIETDTIDLILVFNATFSNISAISWRPVLLIQLYIQILHTELIEADTIVYKNFYTL